VQPDVVARARELAVDPRGHRVKKLVGRPEWRAAVGDYRIVYVINDDAREVVVTVVAHRREVYDR
jgi:mRNA interferase RelE/StbE